MNVCRTVQVKASLSIPAIDKEFDTRMNELQRSECTILVVGMTSFFLTIPQRVSICRFRKHVICVSKSDVDHNIHCISL